MKKLLILFLFHNFFSLGMDLKKKATNTRYKNSVITITSEEHKQADLNKSLIIIPQPKTLDIPNITLEELDHFYSTNTFAPNPNDKAYLWFLNNRDKSTAEIEKSYTRNSLKYHPDKIGGDGKDFQKFTEYKNYLPIFNALQNSTISTQEWAAYFASKEIDLVKKIVCSTIGNVPYSIVLSSAFRVGWTLGSSRESKLDQEYKKVFQESSNIIIENQINYLTTICNSPEQKKQLEEIITDYKRSMT